MGGESDNALPNGWFRITGSAALESDLAGRYKPFWTAAQGVPSFVVLLNEVPFAYFDLVKESTPTEGRVWIPEWNKECVDIRTREGGMMKDVTRQYFQLIDTYQASPQQAAALAFACHRICDKMMQKNWAQSQNIGLFREAGNTSTLFLQLANAHLHHDRAFIDQVRAEQTSNVTKVDKPITSGGWARRARPDLPEDHEAEVVTFNPGGKGSGKR